VRVCLSVCVRKLALMFVRASTQPILTKKVCVSPGKISVPRSHDLVSKANSQRENICSFACYQHMIWKGEKKKERKKVSSRAEAHARLGEREIKGPERIGRRGG